MCSYAEVALSGFRWERGLPEDVLTDAEERTWLSLSFWSGAELAKF